MGSASVHVLRLLKQAVEDKHLQVFVEDLLRTSHWARKSEGMEKEKMHLLVSVHSINSKNRFLCFRHCTGSWRYREEKGTVLDTKDLTVGERYSD